MDNMQTIDALAALAQATRLDAFKLLVRHEPDGLPAGDIATELGVPHNTMSTHLAILARAGLIESERQGRTVLYRADLSCVQALVSFLLKDCCGGKPALCAPLVADLAPCCPPKEKSRARSRL